jgi:hypothetical protein
LAFENLLIDRDGAVVVVTINGEGSEAALNASLDEGGRVMPISSATNPFAMM